MERLRECDFRALLEVIRHGYSGLDFERFVSHVLSGIGGLVRGHLIAYCEMDPRSRRSANWTEPADFMTPKLDEAWLRHMTEHAVLAHKIETGDGQSCKISDFDSLSRFHRRGLYGEFYREADVEDVMGMFIHTHPPVEMGVAIHRDRRSFTERERLLLNLLRPHLAQAWRNARAFTALKAQLRLFQGTLEDVDQGVVVLGPAGRVRLMTPRAQKLLAEYFGEAATLGERLPELLRCWVLQQASALSSKAAPAPRVPLVIEPGGKRLVARLLSGAEEELLLLEEQQAAPCAEVLARLGLSQRESEVLDWVAQGKTNAEIAAILGVSPLTVKKHLEHIFAKLGVETRTAAATLALQAPHDLSAKLPRSGRGRTTLPLVAR